MNATQPLKLQPHPEGAYLVNLRNQLYELPKGMKAPDWATLLQQVTHCDNPQCSMCTTAREYVVGHSPYQSARTLARADLAVRRRPVRKAMWALLDDDVDPYNEYGEIRWLDGQRTAVEVLSILKAYRLAESVGIEQELRRYAARAPIMGLTTPGPVRIDWVFNAGSRADLAAAMWAERQNHIGALPHTHSHTTSGPIASTHFADGRWWHPDALEIMPCCAEIATPRSSAVMKHCCTGKHIAALFAVDPRSLYGRKDGGNRILRWRALAPSMLIPGLATTVEGTAVRRGGGP